MFFMLSLWLNQVQAQKDSSNLQVQLNAAKAKLYVNPVQAQLQLEQVLELAKNRNEVLVQTEAYKQLANLSMSFGKFAIAHDYLTKGILLCESNDMQAQKADLKYAAASIFHAQGNFAIALENYLEALRYYEAHNNSIGSLNTYVALADLFSRTNNFSKAIDYNLKALKLFEQKNDRFRKVNLYEQLGAIYGRQKLYKKAGDYYLKALAAYKEMGNQAGQTATLINLGNNALAIGSSQTAIGFFSNANALAGPLKIVPLEVRSLIGLANAHALLKEYEAANNEYRKAIALAKKAGMKIELDEAYEGLAEVYKSLKNPGASKAFRSLSSEIKDSLFNDSIMRKTADLQLLYETEKKQAQIEIFKQSDLLKELDLKQTKQVKNFFIVLSGLLVLLIFVFVFFISQNRRINAQLKKGMQELEVKNTEVEKQKEQLTQLNQVKDRFFSIISHDLRNNLTTMKLYFDLVSNPEYKAESQSKLGKEVAGSVQNTIDLLENLLVWAIGQLKGVQVAPQKINLHKLASENCDMLHSMAVQKNISIQNDTDEDAFIFADLNMINLIIRNLISNALKFTNEGGSVSILSQEEDAFHQIIVIDNGVGISKEKIDTLFTAHANVSTQGTGNEKGTGLGLMLCKEFVEKNGGEIWVESEENKGSSFYVRFPKA